jgi:hypothetical protein
MAFPHIQSRWPQVPESKSRWISRGGPVAWPPCPHYLNPLDLYSWVHLKSLVYSSPVDDVETGLQATCYMPDIWDRLRVAMRHRAEACTQAGGGHKEHLLHFRACVHIKSKIKLHGFSQQANFTDRLSAKLVPTFACRKCRVVSATDPHGR